jgi:diacylglycerol kinase family enzyme
MTRIALIVNPYSTGVRLARVHEVETVLRRSAKVTRLQTEGPGHATALAAEAAPTVDAIVVYSGDGTYNEAVNGAAGRVPFGFIPGGGTSVVPRALGLPRASAAAAAAVAHALVSGHTRSITLGRANGRLFLFSAGVGLDGEAVRRVDKRGRSADGRRASNLVFGLTIARSLIERGLRLEPQLEVDGYGRAAFVLVANGRPYTYAGPLPFTLSRAASFEDGLTFVAPREVTPRAVPGMLVGMVRGTVSDNPAVLAGHDLDSIAVRCDEPLPLQVDGEDLGDVSEVSFTAERDALTVLV